MATKHKTAKDFDDEFNAQLAALFVVMFIAIVVIGVAAAIGNSRREADLKERDCVLQTRVFTEQVYCGKACFQDYFRHEYACRNGKEVYTGGAELFMRAKDRDDYYTR
ncbi:hypothetical protein D3C87_1351190 [compost metagenome]